MFRVDGRQPFPYRIMEGLPVTRAQPPTYTICWLVRELEAARRCARLLAATFHSD